MEEFRSHSELFCGGVGQTLAVGTVGSGCSCAEQDEHGPDPGHAGSKKAPRIEPRGGSGPAGEVRERTVELSDRIDQVDPEDLGVEKGTQSATSMPIGIRMQ